jgi:hypothetical membrane protein
MGYASFMNVSRPLVSSSTTEILYRSAHVIGGVLGIIFTVGLFYDNDALSHRMGAVFGVLGTAAFCATGIFPEPTGIVHLTAVFASTLLISAAMLLIGGANLDGAHKRAGGLSVALAIIALAGLSLFSYERGVAVVITFAAISVWAFAFGVRRRTHHNKFKNEKRRNMRSLFK